MFSELNPNCTMIVGPKAPTPEEKIAQDKSREEREKRRTSIR